MLQGSFRALDLTVGIQAQGAKAASHGALRTPGFRVEGSGFRGSNRAVCRKGAQGAIRHQHQQRIQSTNLAGLSPRLSNTH